MPSSVMVGSRPPRSCLIFSYSSSVRPCCRIVSGEKAAVREVCMRELLLSHFGPRQVQGSPARPAAHFRWLLLRFWGMKSVIVGTAGHVDHGKTALVKALTGIDADRLAEEKRR